MEGQEEGDVNPGAADIPCSVFTRLEPDSGSQRVTASVVVGVEQLVVETTMRAQRLVREVQRLEVRVDVLRDLIARGEVNLQARVHERGLGTERRVVLVLTELQQVLVTPVPGDARL